MIDALLDLALRALLMVGILVAGATYVAVLLWVMFFLSSMGN